MTETGSQNYANHRRFVPMYHFVLALILLVNTLFAAWQLFRHPSFATALALAVALALIGLWLYARLFPLQVQDRLIRLEERLRLAEILPDELRGRIGELSEDQLIGLRFASDDEVAGLVRRVLDGELSGRESIKKAVQTWRPDRFRC